METTKVRTPLGHVYETPHTVEEIERFVENALRENRWGIVLSRVNPTSAVGIRISCREDLTILPE